MSAFAGQSGTLIATHEIRNVCVNQLNYLNLNIAAERRSVQMINIDCGGHFQFYSTIRSALIARDC